MSSASTLSIFRHLFSSVAEEMGVTLGRTAFSPNIKERLDFSCALFVNADGSPHMLAQAAHIPVHLGAMPASVAAAVTACAPLREGDIVLLNDPYAGGNHLPDLTMVSPIIVRSAEFGVRNEESGVPNSEIGIRNVRGAEGAEAADGALFYVASRAHHADVGGMSPGSMPLSRELFQEGLIIPPLKLVSEGVRNEGVWAMILRNVRTPQEREGDLAAQMAAHAIGTRRMLAIIERYGIEEVMQQAQELIGYAERLTRRAIAAVPDGCYEFEDRLDEDGQSDDPVIIRAAVTVDGDRLIVDFGGTAAATAGNVNAVPAITRSAVVYCLRCTALALLDIDLPMNEGVFRPLEVIIPSGSLLDPPRDFAVAAGNVETSQRIVDVVFGALAQALPELMPAAGQGTMNNLTFGGIVDGRHFAYYETIGGGSGAGPGADGCDGIHVHMSNTLNTPVEALEYAFPIQVTAYSLRHGSGGAGKYRGGDGLLRRIRFLSAASATITSERRRFAPYGLHGGRPGERGRNRLIREGRPIDLSGKAQIDLQAGDSIEIATPGGGGWGDPEL